MRNIDIRMLQPGVTYQPGVDDEVGTKVEGKDGHEALCLVPFVQEVEEEHDADVAQEDLRAER
jgi:hypothetical protein